MSEDIIEKEMRWLFPTVVFKARVNNTKLLSHLKDTVTQMKKDNNPHNQWVKEHFETDDNLHEKPEFKGLVDIVLSQANEVLDHHKIIRDSHYITTMWATSTNKNYYHMLHKHPNCYLSGLIYLTAPKGCGKLYFQDPRTDRMIFAYDYSEYNKFNSITEAITPRVGDIYLWNHWLPHCVERPSEEYTGEEDRMMIAFNVMVKAEIKTKTAKLRI